MNHLTKHCIIYRMMLADGEKATRRDLLNKDKRRREDNRDQDEVCVMIIFGGPEAYQDRRSQELMHWEVYAMILLHPLGCHGLKGNSWIEEVASTSSTRTLLRS
jgi:hypothetical protein